MIATSTEYQKAQEELRDLEARLHRLERSDPAGSNGFTKAGIRKMIARLHEELAPSTRAAKKPGSQSRSERPFSVR
jgi:hypothetical protein